MGEVATSIGLQAVVGALAREGAHDFDLLRTLQSLAEAAQSTAGARGVSIEQATDAGPETMLTVGEIAGSPRRLPIISAGVELGFVAVYGAAMFGPATADRTQMIADLAALAFARASSNGAGIPQPGNDARYRLITGVGHNLRNTLGAATGYIQLAEMESSLTGPQREYVSRSRRAINAAVGLIADLIEVTRADAGMLTFDREPVNLNAVAREAARKHRDAATAKHCDIEVNTASHTPIILTDSSHVQQIVDVLVYNAVRYTPPMGKITVLVDVRDGRRSSDPAKWVCVEVTDTGVGVEEEDQVFEEVYRVEQSKGNVRFKLAICRRIARLLGGDLRLVTEKNVGATFSLWLPAPISPAD